MMNVKETAKQIRKELKEKFPFTKFSVRCERSGSINVSWTDFPTEKAVEEVVSKYEQVQRCEVTGEILSGGNLFVFTRQEWTEETKKKIVDEMHNNYGDSYLNDRACWYRAFNETAEKLYNEFLQSLEQPKEAKQEQQTSVKATYTLNDELNGIEISFTGVPSEEIRQQLKQLGYRWHKVKKIWYAKQSTERLEFAKMLVGEETEEQQTETITDQLEAQQKPQQVETQTEEVTQEPISNDNKQYKEAQEQLESTQAEQQNTEKQPGKIKVKSITFLWSESPVIKDNATVTTWAEANKIIKDIALYADDEGYTKTAFLVRWEDGASYKGIMDVESKHYYKENPFSNEIYNDVLFLAGMKRPAHMTQESYNNYLDSIKSDRESWKNFLNTYMLHDEETPKSPHDPHDHVGKYNNSTENGELAAIVAEETQPLEVLFYHEALTKAQNAKINEILNRHKDSNKFTFVAVYQRQNEAKQAVLHVKTNEGKDLYMSFLLDGSFAFSSHELDYYDHHVYGIKLLHEFTNNSDNMQELSNEQEEKAVNDTVQDVENSNNTNEEHEPDNLQEEQGIMQEEAENFNNTFANESPEDLQVNNAHNKNEVQTLQISYKINDEKNGIELYFSDKPSEAIREQLKRMGFKWSPMRSIWYAKKTDERLQFVLSLLSDSYNSELTEEQRKTLSKRLEKDNVKPLRLFKCKNTSNILLECINTNLDDQKPFYFLIRSNGEEIGKGYNSDILNNYVLIYSYATHNSQEVSERRAYEDINIDDIHTYVIDERLQETEYAASWIFRTQKRDHTKEIQELFTQYNRKVVDLLEQIDNERIKYYLKKSLQSFKKRYFDNYVKILRHRSENPSWAVTGRGNLNKHKYTKALSRYDKLIQESIELTKQIDTAINRTKNEIQKEKEQRIKEAVKNVKNDLTFTVMTKEIEYMGYKERKRVYVYGDYWAARLWGCFRIFKGNREIHEMKSTDKLEDAKRYIAYLVQQEQEKAKNVITA
ncbi:LPD29 domain-containing protein [Geobacillus thermodenitrificans]|uniref:LPD29 domain-containing protein n=1 Tax=Geobacillus thermodenitrificans TaxID=33940 RepID=UPI003D20FC8D